jgi:hypothetical protein
VTKLFGSGVPGLGNIVVGFTAFVSAVVGPAAAFERFTARPFRVRFDFSGCAVAFGAAAFFATFAASR